MQSSSPLISLSELSLQSTCFLYCCSYPPVSLPQVVPGSYQCVLTSLRGLKGLMEGVNKGEKAVVCYQEEGVDLAAQVWWLLQAIGYTDVRVLDGGLQSYNSSQLPVSPLLCPDPCPLPEVCISPALYKLEPEIKKALQCRSPQQLIDTDGSYLGAIHCPARLFFSDTGALSDPESIQLLLTGLGIRLEMPTIVLGKNAAVVLLALSTLEPRRYLCLGVLESRPTGPFLTAPAPSAEPRSFRTEFYSISGNTEYFDAQAEESVRRSIRLPQVMWAPPKKPTAVQERAREREEKKEPETQRSCSLCRLL